MLPIIYLCYLPLYLSTYSFYMFDCLYDSFIYICLIASFFHFSIYLFLIACLFHLSIYLCSPYLSYSLHISLLTDPFIHVFICHMKHTNSNMTVQFSLSIHSFMCSLVTQSTPIPMTVFSQHPFIHVFICHTKHTNSNDSFLSASIHSCVHLSHKAHQFL